MEHESSTAEMAESVAEDAELLKDVQDAPAEVIAEEMPKPVKPAILRKSRRLNVLFICFLSS